MVHPQRSLNAKAHRDRPHIRTDAKGTRAVLARGSTVFVLLTVAIVGCSAERRAVNEISKVGNVRKGKRVDNYSVELRGDRVSSEHLDLLGKLDPLMGLSITDSNLTDLDLAKLPSSMHLWRLTLQGDFTVHALDVLPRFPALSISHISVRELSSADLSTLEPLTHLSSLRIDGDHLADEGATLTFGRLESLRTFGIHSRTKGPIKFANMDRLTNLQRLDLHGVEVDDTTEIGRLPNLGSLKVYGGAVGNLAGVSQIQSLRYLTLHDTDFEIQNVVQLASLPKLENLGLPFNTEITDEGLTYIAQLPRLKSLDLERSMITDEGISELIKLQSLEELILYRTQVTYAGLKQLAQLKHLKRLILNEEQVTEKEAEALAEMLPECEIMQLDNPFETDQ